MIFKLIVLFFFSSSMAFATADGPDYLDVGDVMPSEDVSIHLYRNESSDVLGHVPQNATCLKNLGCIGESNWWCKIIYQGMTGWVKGRFLKESGDCSLSFESNTCGSSPISYPEVFTQKLLAGKNLYYQEQDFYVKLSFLKSNLKSFDGIIVFTFIETENCLSSTIEPLHYFLKDGKIIYYANDGSKTRLTLEAISLTSWTVLEEEDIDGDDQQVDFKEAVKKVYEFENFCEKIVFDYSTN